MTLRPIGLGLFCFGIAFSAPAAELAPVFQVGQPAKQAFSTWAYGYGALTPDGDHVAAYMAADGSGPLRIGSKADVRLDTAQNESTVIRVAGTVSDLIAEANPRTRQSIVTIKIPHQTLPARTYAHVQVELNSRTALAVPTTAIIRLEGKPTVYRQKGDDDFEAVPIEIGEQTPAFTEVKGGLKLGDKILIEGAIEWSVKDTIQEEE